MPQLKSLTIEDTRRTYGIKFLEDRRNKAETEIKSFLNRHNADIEFHFVKKDWKDPEDEEEE